MLNADEPCETSAHNNSCNPFSVGVIGLIISLKYIELVYKSFQCHTKENKSTVINPALNPEAKKEGIIIDHGVLSRFTPSPPNKEIIPKTSKNLKFMYEEINVVWGGTIIVKITKVNINLFPKKPNRANQ